MFYQLKREPTLLRWQAEALQDAALAAPEVGKTLADVHRLTDEVEKLPKNVTAERQALLAALDERMKRTDATVANLRATVSEAKELVTSVGPASDSLKEMFKTADTLWARYDSWDRWSTAAGSRPFDIREYTEGVKELAATADKVNEVLKSSKDPTSG
jgi:DNA repair ATPase RecN